MLDYDLLIITASSLITILIAAGVILLFPVTRKLGRLIESQIQAKEAAAALDAPQLARRRSRHCSRASTTGSCTGATSIGSSRTGASSTSRI
jgi:hypothetical protein